MRAKLTFTLDICGLEHEQCGSFFVYAEFRTGNRNLKNSKGEISFIFSLKIIGELRCLLSSYYTFNIKCMAARTIQ